MYTCISSWHVYKATYVKSGKVQFKVEYHANSEYENPLKNSEQNNMC